MCVRSHGIRNVLLSCVCGWFCVDMGMPVHVFVYLCAYVRQCLHTDWRYACGVTVADLTASVMKEHVGSVRA